jgi:IMP cyclohydrolase
MDLRAVVKANMEALRRNPYPGRGVVIGQSPDGRHAVQVYWIMGRSENSRNRIFVQEGDTVRTAPFDAAKVKDPSLIIYNVARVAGRAHVVTNGDQTDTICDRLATGGTFEQALFTRTYEPDAPNFTPRISGVTALDDTVHAYQLAILKTIGGNPDLPVRCFYNYEKAVPGVGHMLTTYSGDGNPLPSFAGEPQAVEILNDAQATLDLYWAALNAENKVSLLVKFIDLASGRSAVRLVNKHG